VPAGGADDTVGAGDAVTTVETPDEGFAGGAGAGVTTSAEDTAGRTLDVAGALRDSAAREAADGEAAGASFSGTSAFLPLRPAADFTAAVLGFVARGVLGAPDAERDDGLTRTDVRRAASFLKRSRHASSTELRGVAA